MKYRQRRKPTDFKAVLIADDRRMPVTISDASPLGVKVSGLNGVLFPEAEVSLLVRTERFSGQVEWIDKDTAGLSMSRPIPAKVLALITRSTMTGASRFGHRI